MGSRGVFILIGIFIVLKQTNWVFGSVIFSWKKHISMKRSSKVLESSRKFCSSKVPRKFSEISYQVLVVWAKFSKSIWV